MYTRSGADVGRQEESSYTQLLSLRLCSYHCLTVSTPSSCLYSLHVAANDDLNSVMRDLL
ncbi:hypothetical protein BgiBS90_028151, partial [Biomphalaria glabrata]